MAERIRKLPNEPITIYSAPPNGGIDTLVEDSEVVRTLWNRLFRNSCRTGVVKDFLAQ
jgi:hypothetical protein